LQKGEIMERAWLIEKNEGVPKWWNGKPMRNGHDAWSIDSLDGIRFARRIDSEICAIAQGYRLSKVMATEHQWG
jgi:hypothetical protein